MLYQIEFQFTPLREGRQRLMDELEELMRFQFTPLREGRLADSIFRALRHLFQFTPLREGRQADQIHVESYQRISIHAPPRGATEDLMKRWDYWENFNSRPSARGDSFKRFKSSGYIISIHAPPRGATSPH